jgi:hypothetical protein
MLWLHIMPDNAPAIRSAEQLGFRRIPAPSVGEVATLITASGSSGATGLKLTGPGVLSIAREAIAVAGSVRVRASGMSMWPTIHDGSLVTLVEVRSEVRPGQIVLVDWGGNPVLHRVVKIDQGALYTAGDACLELDPPTSLDKVCALATSLSDDRGVVTLTGSLEHGMRSWAYYSGSRMRLALARGWRRLKGTGW